MSRGLLQNAVIAGVYLTDQGRLPDRTDVGLFIESVKGALEDAGLTIREVDGLVGPYPTLRGEATGTGPTSFAEQFGTRLRWHDEVSAGTQNYAVGVLRAALAVATGFASTVVVAIADGASGGQEGGRTVGAADFASPFGLARVARYGMIARRHMYEYGTKPEQLAEVAVASRRHALLSPTAVQRNRGPLTVEDVLNSRMVYDPLHLLDCCLVNNGGGAVIVTTAERARDLKQPPVYILGFGESYYGQEFDPVSSITTFGSRLSADQAFGMAGVRREDIDVAQISDHFTITTILELEDIGYCQKGEGGSFVEGGAIQLGGRLPINTDGGYLSHSHSSGCGLFNIIENVYQLRGEAGERQVPNARLALYHGTVGVMHASATAVMAKA